MAALFLISELICLSKQFIDAFNNPPTNHLANGGFHSRVLFQCLFHTKFSACSAQNVSIFCNDSALLA
jgi:hypothetical protein